MSRQLDPTFAANLGAGVIQPVILAMLTFRSTTSYVWSGIGTLTWDAQSYIGVGSLGKLGSIKEGTEIKSEGTSLMLSGIDPSFKASAMTDIKIGAPAKIWYGHLFNGAFIGAPYLLFSGQMDKPTFSVGGDTISISLALENKMVNHARASNRKYTSADQKANGFPDDTGFDWQEMQNDIAIVWIS